MENPTKEAIFVIENGNLPIVHGSEIAKIRTTDGLSREVILNSYRKKWAMPCIQISTWGKFLQVLFVRCLAIPGTERREADLTHAFVCAKTQ